MYGVEETDGVRAIAMELVEGETLAAWIARERYGRRTGSIDDVLNIAKQIVEALDAAHERGIVHRDLDRRTDIWAFGCVLYEMLAGRTAFSGQTTTDVIAKIVERDPDWSALPWDLPSSISQLPATACLPGSQVGISWRSWAIPAVCPAWRGSSSRATPRSDGWSASSRWTHASGALRGRTTEHR
jgi:serine/threonine protein kinase